MSQVEAPPDLWQTIQDHLAKVQASILYLGPGWAMTSPRKPRMEARLVELYDQLPEDLTMAGLHRCECGAASNFANAVGCLHCERGRLNMSGKLSKLLAFYALRCWRDKDAVRVMCMPHPVTKQRSEFLWLSLGESEELVDLRHRLQWHFGDLLFLNVYDWQPW